MDIDKISALIDLVVDSGVAELEVEQDGLAVRIRLQAHRPVPASHPAAVAPAPLPPASSNTPVATETTADALVGRAVTSPMVGTFYRSPEPGAPNFVEVGQLVSAGDSLCIIETMKTMNEIEAEFDGIVRDICVQNGHPVEAEAVLFLIEPS
jgi:acetyl-CoA carboxylase biotin carboxyl carrier protein